MFIQLIDQKNPEKSGKKPENSGKTGSGIPDFLKFNI